MSGGLVLQAAPAAGVSFLSLPPSVRSSVAVAVCCKLIIPGIGNKNP